MLRLGAGAHAWLLEAAAAGTVRMNVKMAEAVALIKISGTALVDKALGWAATYGRFATGDLASILAATVDRLLHHAHVCQTSGDSIRLTQALAGKGVTAMN